MLKSVPIFIAVIVKKLSKIYTYVQIFCSDLTSKWQMTCDQNVLSNRLAQSSKKSGCR